MKPRRRLGEIDADMLTVPETAAVLGIGVRQTYGAVKAGEIVAVRLGRSIRVPRAVVERLLRGEEQSSQRQEDRLRVV